MKHKYVTAKLQGGTHDGETVEVYQWQQIVYMTKRITKGEMDSLQFDELTSWKTPEEVYERVDKGTFAYLRTVNYKP